MRTTLKSAAWLYWSKAVHLHLTQKQLQYCAYISDYSLYSYFQPHFLEKENACFNIFLMSQKAKYFFFLCTWQVSGERKRNKGLTCLHMHIHNLFPLPGKGNEQSAEKPSWCWGGMSAGEAAGRPPTGPGCPSTTSWHEAGWTACSPYETTAHWQMDLQKQKSFF